MTCDFDFDFFFRLLLLLFCVCASQVQLLVGLRIAWIVTTWSCLLLLALLSFIPASQVPFFFVSCLPYSKFWKNILVLALFVVDCPPRCLLQKAVFLDILFGVTIVLFFALAPNFFFCCCCCLLALPVFEISLTVALLHCTNSVEPMSHV